MLVQVEHTTRLHYTAPVLEAVVEVRLGPLSDDAQRVRRFELAVRPTASARSYRDGFGNTTHLVTVLRSHEALELTATTEVETLLADPFQPPQRQPEPLPPDERASALGATTLIPEVDELRLLAAPFHPDGPERGFDAAYQLMRLVYEQFRYRQHVTTVSSTVADVLSGREGVCQDLAHVLIGLCRSVGLPARYVSGYVVPRITGGIAPRGAGASHAWADVYTASHGWRGFDPTNNLLANDHYVKVASGRDYRDAAPTRGTYRGRAQESLSVAVSTAIQV